MKRDKINNNYENEETPNTDIVINATQENFKEEGESLGDGIELKANLKANDYDNTATYSYNVYLDIAKNNLEYTTNGREPELVLVVQKPDESYLENISGLSKSTITINGHIHVLI